MPTRTRTLKAPKEVRKPAVKTSRVLKAPQCPRAAPSKKSRTLNAQSMLERLASPAIVKLGLPATDSDLNKLATPEAGEELSSRVKTRARVLRQRRRKRLRKYLDTAFDAKTAGATFLETQAVTAPVQRYYAKEMEEFRIHAAKHGYNLQDPDMSIAQYLNSLFWKGEQPHKGEKFLAAWLQRCPDFGRVGSRKLPRSWRALKGWRRLCPTHSRHPMPLCVWAAVAVELVKMQQARMALFVLLSVSTYARPSELLRCLTRCLVRPTASALHEWAILLAPTELETPTKTGEFDHSVPLDSQYLKPWITILLEALKTQHPNSCLWDFQHSEYLSAFKTASERLQMNLSPYQTRHSDPSIDRAKKLRTLHEVQKRGNWRSTASVLRYEKAGRLSLSYQSLKPHIREYCDNCEALLGEVLLGKRRPPAGP